MDCIELTHKVLLSSAGDFEGSVIYNNVMNAVAALSPLFDTDERNSFDVEVIRADGVADIVISFSTYYFQFNKMDEELFGCIFLNAERLVVSTIGDDNLVNVRLVYRTNGK